MKMKSKFNASIGFCGTKFPNVLHLQTNAEAKHHPDFPMMTLVRCEALAEAVDQNATLNHCKCNPISVDPYLQNVELRIFVLHPDAGLPSLLRLAWSLMIDDELPKHIDIRGVNRGFVGQLLELASEAFHFISSGLRVHGKSHLSELAL